MEDHFWKIVERGLDFDVPDFIKNSFTMCGFANVISFKQIDDEQIKYVEDFIQTEMIDILTKDANNSFGGDCDALIEHDILVQHFGNRYASSPRRFKFESGDRILIRELVNHVKKEADSSGIHQFRMKKKKSYQRTNNTAKKYANLCDTSNENKSPEMIAKSTTNDATDIEFQSILKSALFEKVKNCLRLYKIDTKDFGEEMIQLDLVDENIYGVIHCAVCKQNGKKSKPKRVSYHTSPESSYWVLSNFPKDLENVHSLVATKCNQNRKKKTREKTKENPEAIKQSNSIDELNEIFSVHSDENNSPHTDTLDDVIMVHDDMNNNGNYQTPSLLDQMSLQMKTMVTAVLNNGEDFEQMDILIERESRRVSVVKTLGDGNCLPSALAHQLFNQPLGSRKHTSNTNNLRSTVVEHILQPENISRYRFSIEEHMRDVHENNRTCEEFVRDVLSQTSQWMGLETLKAVSNIYAVTIIIFNEDGSCYAIRGDARDYDKTIVIAYRWNLNANEEIIYNHYDSVVDIDACTLHDSAKFITKK